MKPQLASMTRDDSASVRLLCRAHVLRKSDTVDGAQHRRTRREKRRRQELRIKAIPARRRTVHRGAAFEDADGLLAIEEAYQGALVIQRAAPGFQIAQEVVYAAVGSVILRRARHLHELEPFPGGDCRPVRGGIARASAGWIVGIGERVDVVPRV